ncbi:MAG: hypothetical protein JWM18_3361 [Chloroflexi bacterium]|nr:hypothetical protein [Chloroflexota bacterium]
MLGAIDIGGTKLLAAVAGDDRRPGPAVRRPTPAERPVDTLMEMLDEVRGDEQLEGLALAVPGPFDRSRGALVNPPNMPPCWRDLPLAERLVERYGCPVLLRTTPTAQRSPR